MTDRPTLTFVGTGEAADPELPNTSLLYRGSRNLLFDCGYSVPQALWRVTQDPELLDAIVISHRHADHCFGLPGLLLWLRDAGRQRPLLILGGPGVAAWLGQLTDLAYPGFIDRSQSFSITPRELSPGAPFPLGPLALQAAASDHSLPNLALRVEDGDLAVCFSGDGAPTPATEEMYQNATLLVHECFSEVAGKKGHAHLAQVLALAARAKVSRLALVHLGVDERLEIKAAAERQSEDLALMVPVPGDILSL